VTRPADAHDAFAELAAGHALYALEPEDEQAFLAHLAGCAACERDVAEHRETLTHLAYASDAGEPPAAVLAGIREGVRASGRVSASEPPASLEQARKRRVRRPAGAPGLRRATTWLGAAAAVALLASLAVWNTALQRDQERAGSDFDSVVSALQRPGTETVPLQDPETDEVVLVALVNDGEMSLVVEGLEPNDPAATSYVLWGRNDLGGVRAVSTFDVTGAPHQVLEGIPLDGEMTAFMVTHEQGNTPPPVSTQPVLAVGEA
jgi:anti-sigma factor RsiW